MGFEALEVCKNYLIIYILRILFAILLIYLVNTSLTVNAMATSNWPSPNYHKLPLVFIQLNVLYLNPNLITVHFYCINYSKFPAAFIPVVT